MNKRFFITAVLAVACSCYSIAESYQTSDGYQYELDPETMTAEFTGIAEENKADITFLAIPSVLNIDGSVYEITSMGERCCYSIVTMTSANIGENVKTIKGYAFSYCSFLTSVSLPEGLQEIGEMCFYNCTSLTGCVIPSTVTTIDDYAFFYVPKLESIHIPASVTKLGNGPFSDCPKLASITIDPENPAYTVYEGVLFSKDMTELINYPIGDKKTSYTVPASVKVIGSNSMRNNPTMTEIVLNEGLEVISHGAFNVSKLKSVYIPESVKEIGTRVFTSSPSILEFNVAPGNQHYKATNGMLLTKDGRKLLYGIGAVNNVVIPDGVEDIEEYSFYKFYSISSVSLPSTVKSIGDCAFFNCNNISKIEFGNGIESIGLQAFYGCRSLTDLHLPASLRFIGSAAFSSCLGLKTVEIEEGLERTDGSVFHGCMALTSAIIPGSLSDLSDGMFYFCPELLEVQLGEGIKRIGRSCFASCSTLSLINFPSTLEEIDGFAFESSAIVDVDFQEGLRTIGEGAFEWCMLREVTLPSTVEEIGYLTFGWNPDLEYFNCGDGLRKIGEACFGKCSSLKGIYLNENLTEIGRMAFAGCESIETLEIPSTVKSVGSEAFNETMSLTEIIMHPTTPPSTDGNLYSEFYDGYSITKLRVPAPSVSAYKASPEWGKFAQIEGTAAIEGISIDFEKSSILDIYNVNGDRINEPVNGVNIIRMNDGSTKKVLINN